MGYHKKKYQKFVQRHGSDEVLLARYNKRLTDGNAYDCGVHAASWLLAIENYSVTPHASTVRLLIMILRRLSINFVEHETQVGATKRGRLRVAIELLLER